MDTLKYRGYSPACTLILCSCSGVCLLSPLLMLYQHRCADIRCQTSQCCSCCVLYVSVLGLVEATVVIEVEVVAAEVVVAAAVMSRDLAVVDAVDIDRFLTKHHSLHTSEICQWALCRVI